MFLLLFIIVVMLFVIILSALSLMRDTRNTNVIGPTPMPIIGNGHILYGDTAHFLKKLGELKNTYGNIFRIHILNQRFFIISDPILAEPVMSNIDFITKSDTYKHLRPWLGDGLLTSTGYKWKTHRKLLTPAFHFNILRLFLETFVKNDKIFIEKMQKVADGRTVDVFPYVALLALDNISECAMGVELNAQSETCSKYVEAITTISEIISMRMFNIALGKDFIFNLHPFSKKQQRALKVLHDQTNMVLQSRCEKLQGSHLKNADEEYGIKKKCTFLDMLLLTEIDGKKLSLNDVREEVDTFMFEGHDTTSSAISFTFYCLSKNMDVQQKLYEEISEIYKNCGANDISYGDLQKMKYLELVIKETLRLYPSVPLIGRVTPYDFEIDNNKILKNSQVVIDVFHMQRDAKYFDDPLEFRPERFIDDTKHNFSWVAFSAGPRNCIGQKFAMVEMKLAISSFVKHFKILPVDYEPILGADLIIRSKNGINVKFLPRD